MVEDDGGTARRASRRTDVASVELRALTKRYGEVAIVDDVSLTIEHGRLVCLLGPSGCGKTTTLPLIAGFVEPSAETRAGLSGAPEFLPAGITTRLRHQVAT